MQDSDVEVSNQEVWEPRRPLKTIHVPRPVLHHEHKTERRPIKTIHAPCLRRAEVESKKLSPLETIRFRPIPRYSIPDPFV